MHSRIALVALVVLAGASAGAESPDLRARVDRDAVRLDETVNLVLELQIAGTSAGPDLSALERDFEVLGTSSSTEVRFENGRQSGLTRWLVELAPRRTGILEIPSIALGTFASAPIRIRVAPPDAAGPPGGRDVYLEVEASPERPYMQAQITYTVRLYRAVELLEGTISEPAPDGADVHRLGKDSPYRKTVGGRRYDVVERRFAIFAQAPGELVIGGVAFDGRVARPGSGGGLGRIFGGGRRVRLVADTLRIEVRPKPAAFTGRHWLPAKALSVREHWAQDPPALREGEPVTRTLRIAADGLAAAQLPPVEPARLEGVRSYPDQASTSMRADLDVLRSVREQRVAIVPTRTGPLSLPEIRIPWWDTEADAERVAIVPARTLEIRPPDTVPTSPTAGLPAAADEPGAPSPRTTLAWQALSALLLAAWIATLVAWRRTRLASVVRTDAEPSVPPGARAARAAVERACRDDDARAARAALLAWAASLDPGIAPRGLRALAARCRDPALAERLDELDRALYRDGAAWHGAALREALHAAPDRGPILDASAGGDPRDPLPPLHPPPAARASS